VSDQLPSPQQAAFVPPLCARHQRVVVQRLKLPPDSWWQLALAATTLTCFRAATFDPRFQKRTEGDPAGMSIVLAEIGCLGCWQPRAIEVAVSIMKRDGAWLPLFELAHGAKRLTDPLWPLDWVLPPEKAPTTSEAMPNG
jgi:hypothetical protein